VGHSNQQDLLMAEKQKKKLKMLNKNMKLIERIIWKMPICRLQGIFEYPLEPFSSALKYPFSTVKFLLLKRRSPMVQGKNCWISLATMILALFISISGGQAQQPVEWTQCFSGTSAVSVATEELRVFTFESKGITMSNIESKLFNNMSSHCMGATKVVAGKRTSITYSKYLDSDGDFVVLETIAIPGEKEDDWKFIHGTGKWKGIKGSGKWKVVARGKPMTPGTFNNCYKAIGTFELAK